MTIEKTKDLAYYEALPYTIVVRKDEDGEFVGRIQELPGCIAHGETEASAIERLRSMQKLWLEDALSAGDAIPEPEDDPELPSGKWLQRVPRRLHKDLVAMARRENISLNQLVTSMLSEAVTGKSCAHAFQVYLATLHPTFYQDASCWQMDQTSQAWLVTSPTQKGSIVKALSAARELTSRSSQWSDPEEPHLKSHELARK